ncbi:hypothetical protein BDZ91DRAFT_798507 [Kalaharituber pfeilii]|nr:hypothetical protein BDZ91DRAFT_798507 [Kalaharituber pfeilii]
MHALPKSIIALVLLFGVMLAYALPSGEVFSRGLSPPLGSVSISSISYAGSGCPAGTINIAPSQDYSSLTIAFNSYVASIGPGIPVTEKRKNCVISFVLSYPPGWSFTLYQIGYKGRLSLDPQVTATQKSVYWFDANSNDELVASSTWTGPLYGHSYDFTDTLAKQVWSPCNGRSTLFANTQVRLNNSGNKQGYGFISTDIITGKVTHVLFCQWKTC